MSAVTACRILEEDGGYLPCSGSEPYPADTLQRIILSAARASARQPTINTAVQFLQLLKPTNRTALSDRLAFVFSDELNYFQSSTRRGPAYPEAVLLLSLAASFPQAVYKAFALVSQMST